MEGAPGIRRPVPGRFTGLWRSLRPVQWVKNIFVFAALVFSRHLLDLRLFGLTLFAFAAFCAVSSAIYLVNDLVDRKEDRRHPLKKSRPIAAGIVPPAWAVGLALLLFGGGLSAGAWIGGWFLATLAAYCALSLAYCFGLKRIVILDVMVLAGGYTLRAVGGAAAIEVSISNWLLLCTSLLALFLGFCKRRSELTSLQENASAHRPVLAAYSEQFLDQMIAVVTASTAISYIFYALSPEVAQRVGTPHLGLTVPFVLYGIFRYFFVVHVRGGGGRPDRDVLGDPPLLANLFLYGLAVLALLYWG